MLLVIKGLHVCVLGILPVWSIIYNDYLLNCKYIINTVRIEQTDCVNNLIDILFLENLFYLK